MLARTTQIKSETIKKVAKSIIDTYYTVILLNYSHSSCYKLSSNKIAFNQKLMVPVFVFGIHVHRAYSIRDEGHLINV